jgi:hypothetical protein
MAQTGKYNIRISRKNGTDPGIIQLKFNTKSVQKDNF